LEESDTRIAYSDGLHAVDSANAAGGHFRLHMGNSPAHSASLTFNVAAGKSGKLIYSYATSTKGGSAEVVLDGSSRTISYLGTTGGLKDPVFGMTTEFANLAPGAHTLQIKTMTGAVYIDRFCLESSSSNSQPASGPGPTTTNNLNLTAGQVSTSALPVASGATAISVVAAANGNVPIKLVLLNPSGLTLQSVDSVNGVAVLTAPVSASGSYTVKVVNVSLGPVQVWTAATPTMTR